MPEILAILLVDEPYSPRTLYLLQLFSVSPPPDGSAPTPISLPTTSLLKLWSPYSFWHPLLASHVFSVTSSFSRTSPWASTPALHLSPAQCYSGASPKYSHEGFEPSEPPWQPRFEHSNFYGEWSWIWRDHQVKQRFPAILFPKWYLEPVQGIIVTFRYCSQLLLLSNSLMRLSVKSIFIALKLSPMVWVSGEVT